MKLRSYERYNKKAFQEIQRELDKCGFHVTLCYDFRYDPTFSRPPLLIIESKHKYNSTLEDFIQE